MSLDEHQLKSLVSAVSTTRFQPFLDECGDDPVRALRLYAWNSEISGAFRGAMLQFEITLRDGLHGRLSTLFGQSDWWRASDVVLHSVGTRQVAKVEKSVLKRCGVLSPHEVADGLPLGFWVGLVGKGVNYETQFWRPSLRHAFPGYTGGRKELHRQLDYLRHFRNHLTYGEQIFHRHLEADFRAVCRVIRYMSPEVAMAVERYSGVPAVLARKAVVLSGDEPPRL